MAKFIREREHCEEAVHYLFFQLRGHTAGTGKSFRCSAEGVALDEHHRLIAAQCEHDSEHYAPPVVETSTHRWTVPGAIECGCGLEVELDRFTNTCECGRDYNMSGELLAPREQWGEETGEHWTDCV